MDALKLSVNDMQAELSRLKVHCDKKTRHGCGLLPVMSLPFIGKVGSVCALAPAGLKCPIPEFLADVVICSVLVLYVYRLQTYLFFEEKHVA